MSPAFYIFSTNIVVGNCCNAGNPNPARPVVLNPPFILASVRVIKDWFTLIAVASVN